jgi:Rrf2 family protein
MSTLLSKSAEYGIRAVLYIASNQNKLIALRDISKELKVPHHFLAKIVQKLVKAGIIKSKKGKKGGLRLGKKPSKLKIIEVISIIDGEAIFKECVLGLPDCSDKKPCAVHTYWKNIRDEIIKMFSERTIQELIEGEIKL